MNLRSACILAAASLATLPVTATGQITVGPGSGASCGGAACDMTSIQDAIDAATPGTVIRIYRRTDDNANNQCYNEHLVVDVPGVTLEGASVDPASVACIAPATPGDLVVITASDVTLRNLHISGKANDGSGGTNALGTGTRSDGHGVHVLGTDVENVQVHNCTVDFVFGDNVRFDGDLDNDGIGFITVKQCYLHHSDTLRNVRLLGGGGISTQRHVIRNNLIHTGQGIMLRFGIDHASIDHNVIKGWPFWGHFGAPGGEFPEQRVGPYGGGWRYYSNCFAGIRVLDAEPIDLDIHHNLIIGTWTGIRTTTTGSIRHNTIVNPFNPDSYDFDGEIHAADIRDNTFGILIDSGFSGTIQNNLVVVTPDNRANGMPGSATPPYYTPGITGHGIAFGVGTGTLDGAVISHNNVWGFVDIDGTTPLNYGPGIPRGSTNISVAPNFAPDLVDEANGGNAPCHADANTPSDTRCYEMYEDNYFLGSTQVDGSCHARIRGNTAGGVTFVDLSDGGATPADSDAISGLAACERSTDAADSRAIDFGSGAIGAEPEKNGDSPNLGAFGGTARGSRSPTLKVVSITVGAAGIKSGDPEHNGPGMVQPRAHGLTVLDIQFNRAVVAEEASFEIRDLCDGADLSEPAVDLRELDMPPYTARLTWPAERLVDTVVRVHVLGAGPGGVVDVEDGDALDGEISDLINGTFPSGNGVAGGTAEFVVFAMTGDTNGDRRVTPQDLSAISNQQGQTGEGLFTDIDGDGVVEGDFDEDDYLAVAPLVGHHWITSTANGNTPGTLRYALNTVANGQTIRFDPVVFAACKADAGVSILPTSALPVLDNDDVIIDATWPGVRAVLDGQSAPTFAEGLDLTGARNRIRGLVIRRFDAAVWIHGVLATGNIIGGPYDPTAPNGLGQGCRLSDSNIGVRISHAADANHVRGSLIGTTADGLGAAGNTIGVWIDNTAGNVIGGTTAATGNIISGNQTGVSIEWSTAALVIGNTIGLNATGTAPLPNTHTGVVINRSVATLVGGTGPTSRNVVSGNTGSGIEIIRSTNTVLQGNTVGMDRNGTLAVGNGGSGILLSGSNWSRVGGALAGQPNLISHNGDAGIAATGRGSQNNLWLGNLVFGNGTLPVFLDRLVNDSITPPVLELLDIENDVALLRITGLTAGAAIDLYTNATNTSDCTVHMGLFKDGGGDDQDAATGIIEQHVRLDPDGRYVVAIQTSSTANSSQASPPLKAR